MLEGFTFVQQFEPLSDFIIRDSPLLGAPGHRGSLPIHGSLYAYRCPGSVLGIAELMGPRSFWRRDLDR